MDEDAFTIHHAAKIGGVQAMKHLIEAGVSVDSRDPRDRTPLHWAAECGQYAVAEFLISSNCEVDCKDRHGSTPVLLAVNLGNKRIVKLLLHHGALVNCLDDEKKSLLHFALEMCWTNIALLIIEKGKIDVNDGTRYGTTFLIETITGGHEDVIALLVQAGADINKSDQNGMTALHWAVFNGSSTNTVQLLLDTEGLDINSQTIFGSTALHITTFGRLTPLSHEVMKQLLEAGADPNIKNDEGITVLNYYLDDHDVRLQMIELFVQKGAFFSDEDYARICENPFLKENVLKDEDLCAQSVVNKFSFQTLPALYSSRYFVRMLPAMDKLKLNTLQKDEVRNFVRRDIQQNTFCNIVRIRLTSLSALCIQSLAIYITGRD